MSVENIKTDKELKGAYLTGERPLFHGKKLHIEQTIFNDGESPLKESRDFSSRAGVLPLLLSV